jgi:hypothetical protein
MSASSVFTACVLVLSDLSSFLQIAHQKEVHYNFIVTLLMMIVRFVFLQLVNKVGYVVTVRRDLLVAVNFVFCRKAFFVHHEALIKVCRFLLFTACSC